MLPEEPIRRIRKLEIATRKVVSEMLAGQYHSVFKGRGMAFSEVRQYQPGDEIRAIDWNVTARMNDAYVKVFTEERELTVMLVVDVSASKEFGSRGRSKSEIAAEVAAQIAFSAIANNDRVGLILFSDRVEKLIPPKKGRKHVLRLITDILSFAPKGKGTDLAAGLNYLSQVSKRKAVTFLISDFLARDYEQPLRVVGRRHDLVPVVISDPVEARFPKLGLVELEDPETGERLVVDARDPLVRGTFSKQMQRFREERRRLFQKLSLDHVELDTGEDHGAALARFFRARAEEGGRVSPALLWAALALAAAGGGGQLFQPLAFEQRAAPEKARLGDPFIYELKVTHPPDQRYELRPPRDLGDLELTSQERSRQDEAGRAVTTFRLHMAAFQLGKQKLPDLTFDVVGPDASGTFQSSGPEVEIVATLSEAAAQNGEALYDIQPPADVPVRTWRLLWALAALLAAAALAYAALRWLRRPGAAAQEKVLPKDPLDVRTRRALDELRAQDLPGQRRYKEFHFRLSEILRGYLAERYGFEALESTSPELLEQLRRRHTPGLDFDALERHVNESDLVKFARADTTPEDCKRELELAHRLVKATTFALAPPPVPEHRTAPRPPRDGSRPVP